VNLESLYFQIEFMNSILISSYLQSKDNIEAIQAYALWAHDDVKRELLTFKDKAQLLSFLREMTGGRKYSIIQAKRNQNAITISYSIKFPIGNTFSMKVAKIGYDLCIITILIIF